MVSVDFRQSAFAPIHLGVGVVLGDSVFPEIHLHVGVDLRQSVFHEIHLGVGVDMGRLGRLARSKAINWIISPSFEHGGAVSSSKCVLNVFEPRHVHPVIEAHNECFRN